MPFSTAFGYPPHPRPPWRLGSPRYPGPRSASHGRLNPSPAISRAAAEDRSYDPSLLCPPSGVRSTEPARSPRTPNKRLEVPHDPVPGPAEAPPARDEGSTPEPTLLSADPILAALVVEAMASNPAIASARGSADAAGTRPPQVPPLPH